MRVVVVVELEQKGLLALLPLGVLVAQAEPVISQDQLFITQAVAVAERTVLPVLVQYRAVPVVVAAEVAVLLAGYQELQIPEVVVAAEDIIIMPPEQAGQE